MRSQCTRRLVLLVACETRLVRSILLEYLASRITLVHRMTAQAGYSIAGFALDETGRPQQALIFVGGQPG
jgi:hypothetical protein